MVSQIARVKNKIEQCIFDTDLYKRIPSPWKYDVRRICFKRYYDQKRHSVRHLKHGPDEYYYSYPSFDRAKSIFIHVPKCAGISVAISLFGCLGVGHETAQSLRMVYGRDFWRYFRFTIVRNPFSRLVSAYTYLLNGNHTVWKANKKAQKELKTFSEFDDFVENGLQKWSQNDLHFKPQIYYITLDDKIAVDKIMCVESLKDDFQEIKDRVNPNAILLRKNRSKRDHSVEQFYTSDKTIRIVQDIYSEDFRRLGYDLVP